MNRRNITWLVAAILVTVVLFLFIQVKQDEAARKAVHLTEESEKVVVFYRDDCSDCQQVYPSLWWLNQWQHNLIFINTNHQANRKYLRDYHIQSVPTVYFNGETYHGTDVKGIKRFIKETHGRME